MDVFEVMRILFQVGLLFILAVVSDYLKVHLHLPIPGPIIGMAILFFLLKSGLLKLRMVEIGAEWLLAELLLFFVPSAVGVIQYQYIFAVDGVRLAMVILASTLIVMGITGVMAEKMYGSKASKREVV